MTALRALLYVYLLTDMRGRIILLSTMNDAATCSTWPAPPPGILLLEAALPLIVRHEPRIVRECGCGRRHDISAWIGLPYVGLQEDGDGGWLILRNCPCGSTLATESEAP